MKTVHLFVISAALAGAPCAWAADSRSCQSPVPHASVEIDKAAGGAILSYRFPGKISCFRLSDAGKVRALTWTMLTAGAKLVDDGNTVVLATPARRFDVSIVPFARDGQIDRVYSPVIAFGDRRAMAVYSRYLAASEATKLVVRFKGYLPLGSSAHVGQHAFTYRGDDTYLIVGEPKVTQRGQSSLVLDRATPPWLIAHAGDSVIRGTSALAKHFSLPRRLTYLVTYTEAEADIAQWRGDTSGQLVRLNFMGARWQSSDPTRLADLTGFILHELFHTVNHVLAPSVPGDGGLSLLEGSAEAAASSLRNSLGVLDERAFAGVKDAALLRCQSIPGNTLADKERNNTRAAPYACGAAIQYLGAALLTGDAVGPDAMLRVWRQMLLDKTGPYDWARYFAALRALAGPQTRPQVELLEKLVSGAEPLSSVLAGLERQHLIRKLTDREQQGAAQSAFFAQLTLDQILDSQCTGMRGTYSLDGIYTLDAPAASCAGLPDKFPVASINGYALAQQGHDAYLEHQRRCAARGQATLHDAKGAVISLACSEPRQNVELYSFLH